MTLDIDPDELVPAAFEVSVTIESEVIDEYDLLRRFTAAVDFQGEFDEKPTPVGTLTGWLSRNVWEASLTDAGDCIDSDAELLGRVADSVVETLSAPDEALLINRATLLPEWRGHKLLGLIVEKTVEVLQLRPSAAIVTLPEPLALDGSGRLDDGPERDAGLAKLHASCRAAGFQPWNGGKVWWRMADLGMQQDLLSDGVDE